MASDYSSLDRVDPSTGARIPAWLLHAKFPPIILMIWPISASKPERYEPKSKHGRR